jgi:aspartate-semialdehyde dehydrogenase
MAPDVPLVIPTVNIDHLHAIPAQRLLRGVKRGFLVTNSNCASTGISVALKALQQQHGQDAIRQVNIVTMQAISGAGYPGVSAMDLMDNMIPHIGGEEDKLETEPLKILGGLREDLLQVRDLVAAGDTQGAMSLLQSNNHSIFFTPLTDCVISASCNRVAVLDGHTACVSVGLNPSAAKGNTDALITNATNAFTTYIPPVSTKELACYSAPQPSIHVLEAVDRPQPRLDRDLGRGYAVSIGRVRPCPLLDLKFVVLSHNTILGAAGSSILNAEAAYAMGYLTRRSSTS